MHVVDAGEALGRLKEGNSRFMAGRIDSRLVNSGAVAPGQEDPRPFAIVLCSSDARVPPEILFDQGLGELLVMRTPGNTATASRIAAIEAAVERFDSKLVIVLGNSGCTAVQTVLDQLRQPGDDPAPELDAMVRSIAPAVEDLLSSAAANDEAALLAQAVEANILASVENLLHGSEILESRVASAGVLILGAHYGTETGKVSFFE